MQTNRKPTDRAPILNAVTGRGLPNQLLSAGQARRMFVVRWCERACFGYGSVRYKSQTFPQTRCYSGVLQVRLQDGLSLFSLLMPHTKPCQVLDIYNQWLAMMILSESAVLKPRQLIPLLVFAASACLAAGQPPQGQVNATNGDDVQVLHMGHLCAKDDADMAVRPRTLPGRTRTACLPLHASPPSACRRSDATSTLFRSVAGRIRHVTALRQSFPQPSRKMSTLQLAFH